MAVENAKDPEQQPSISVKEWFDRTVGSGTMTVESVPLSNTSGWGPYVDSDGRVVAFGTVDSNGNPTNKYWVLTRYLDTTRLSFLYVF